MLVPIVFSIKVARFFAIRVEHHFPAVGIKASTLSTAANLIDSVEAFSGKNIHVAVCLAAMLIIFSFAVSAEISLSTTSLILSFSI